MANTQVLDLYNHPNYTSRSGYIQQQVERILKTPLGSVPGRINHGSLLHTMVSYPASEWHKIVNECYRACDEGLDFWLELVQVEVEFSATDPRSLTIIPTVKDKQTDGEELTLSGIEIAA